MQSLSIISTAFKFTWFKYKVDKKIKEREPYIKALLETKEGIAIQRAILESPGSKRIYIDTEYADWVYLDDFEKEQLLDVTTRASSGNGSMYSFELTNLGKKYFST